MFCVGVQIIKRRDAIFFLLIRIFLVVGEGRMSALEAHVSTETTHNLLVRLEQMYRNHGATNKGREF